METIEKTATKTCPKCGRTLPASEYWTAETRKDKLYTYCKECAREMRKDMILPFNINDKAKNVSGGGRQPSRGLHSTAAHAGALQERI